MKRLAFALLGIALLSTGWYVAFRPVGDEVERTRLHDLAGGSVTNVQVLDPTYTRLTVSWEDLDGHHHASRFDTDTYPWNVGDGFGVRYDLHDPSRRVLPADPDDTSNDFHRENAYGEGGATAGAGVALLVVPPALSWRRHRWEASLKRGNILTWRQLDLPGSPPFAWEAPGVATRWDAYSRWAPRFLALGILVAIGAAALFVGLHRADERLLRTGVHVRGTVLDGGGFGSRSSQDHIVVAYTDAAGHRHKGDLHGPGPDDVPGGGSVEVVYDPRNPSDFRTRGYPNHSNIVNSELEFAPTMAALFLGASVWVFCMVRLGSRAMKLHPWLDARIVERDEGWLIDAPYLEVELDLPGRPALQTRLGSASKNALDGFLVDEGGTLRVCPGEGRRFLIDADGLDRPYVALLPRSVRQARRWARVAR